MCVDLDVRKDAESLRADIVAEIRQAEEAEYARAIGDVVGVIERTPETRRDHIVERVRALLRSGG